MSLQKSARNPAKCILVDDIYADVSEAHSRLQSTESSLFPLHVIVHTYILSCLHDFGREHCVWSWSQIVFDIGDVCRQMVDEQSFPPRLDPSLRKFDLYSNAQIQCALSNAFSWRKPLSILRFHTDEEDVSTST